MTKKTFSQKAALIFEVVGYALLIPATLSILLTLIFPFLIFIPLFFTAIGVVLLVGYYKHSRGLLGKGKIIPLWLATLLFNGLPLLPVLKFVLTFDSGRRSTFEDGAGRLYFVLAFWWIIAVALSAASVWDELKIRSKMR